MYSLVYLRFFWVFLNYVFLFLHLEFMELLWQIFVSNVRDLFAYIVSIAIVLLLLLLLLLVIIITIIITITGVILVSVVRKLLC